MREIVWTRAAESDLLSLYQELEGLQAGMGEKLLSLIDAALQLLGQFPELAPAYDAPLRRLLLNNGRHGLFYCFEGGRLILRAVADLQRDPDELRRRFRKLINGS